MSDILSAKIKEKTIDIYICYIYMIDIYTCIHICSCYIFSYFYFYYYNFYIIISFSNYYYTFLFNFSYCNSIYVWLLPRCKPSPLNMVMVLCVFICWWTIIKNKNRYFLSHKTKEFHSERIICTAYNFYS